MNILIKAERNERLGNALALLPERHTEWEITIFFYSALHYVNAFLELQGLEVPHHFARYRLVSRLTNFAKEYENLFQKGINARYKMDEFTAQEVESTRTNEFLTVKEGVLALLAAQM